jgi:pyruvate formate lyase activating enzyme
LTDSAVIFNIQRFSIHDGPGIRTTLFLKGCSLNCFWCHNPEGIRTKPEIQFYSDRCIYCGECLKICTHSAHSVLNHTHEYDRELCVACGECVSYCYSNALELTGKVITVEDAFSEIIKDREYYQTSGGGVTLSGGEPLLHGEFSKNLLKKCKEEKISTAIETSGNCRWSQIEDILPFTDLIMMDIKHMDSVRHKQVTGVPNELILENARKLSGINIPIIFRIPVIPTVNDTKEEVAEIADFVSELQKTRNTKFSKEAAYIKLELLQFHRLAGDKYKSLEMDNRADKLKTYGKSEIEELKECARSFGINVK